MKIVNELGKNETPLKLFLIVPKIGLLQVLTFAILSILGSSIYLTPSFAANENCTNSPTHCWTMAGGNHHGTQYSGLNLITPSNVGNLTPVLKYSLQPTADSRFRSQQGSPIVVTTTDAGVTKQTIYVVTAFPQRLLAFDVPANGSTPTLSWTYSANPGAFSEGLTCCDSVNRGPAYGAVTTTIRTKIKGKIITSTTTKNLIVYTLLDGNVIAVDTKTRTQAWRKKVADPWAGETLNTSPIIVASKDPSKAGKSYVIFGSSGSEMGIRGSVRALDLATGNFEWQAYSTGTDDLVKINGSTVNPYEKDRGVDQGKSSWPDGMDAHGGGSVWTWVTYDEVNHTIFYGTSQPGTFNPTMRPGANKWGSSIFARDPETGNAKWVYQNQPHDNWDYDSMNENTVVSIDHDNDGSTPKKDVIVHLHKNGIAYVMDRVTGQIYSANSYGFENWSGGGIDLITGYPLSYTATSNISGDYTNNKKTQEGSVTNFICPSPFGVKNWGYSSFDEVKNVFYLGTFNYCMNYRPTRVNFIAGTPSVGVEMQLFPSPGGNGFPGSDTNYQFGEFVAFNPSTGARKWEVTEKNPVVGGALSTAGGVVFYGTTDGYFKALNSDDGVEKYKSSQLGCGIVSAPITFKGLDNKQRVAFVTGLGWLNAAFAGTSPCAGSLHVLKQP